MILLIIGFILLMIFLTKGETKKMPYTPEQVNRAKFIYTKWATLIIKYAGINGVDAHYIFSIIYVESGGNPDAIGDDGRSIGLMQIQLPTAQMVGYTGSKQGLLNPETNINYGSKYLRKCLDKNTNFFNACRAYNGGYGWTKASAKSKANTLIYANKVQDVYNVIKGF